jgi:hypothetical protein
MPKNLISIHDFSKKEILHIVDIAEDFEKNKSQNILNDKVVACIFFEPSTRTRLSFETAANRLGARVIGFADAANTSIAKGESLKDTIKMVSNYVDIIVIRHPLEGAARYASEISYHNHQNIAQFIGKKLPIYGSACCRRGFPVIIHTPFISDMSNTVSVTMVSGIEIFSLEIGDNLLCLFFLFHGICKSEKLAPFLLVEAL